LSERESDIAHLSETLQKSEQTTKKMRNALDKLEQDNESLRSEVSQLKKQLHGVAGLHAKAIETETEHDKSKKRRENETKQAEVALRGEMGQ
jgi:regulator of replication initiation timing